MVPRGIRTAAHSQCGCCNAGVEESIKHALFECGPHGAIRRDFIENVQQFHPEFSMLSTDERLQLLLAEDTPRKIDGFLYRFLIQIFESRERRLVSGLAGSRPQG